MTKAKVTSLFQRKRMLAIVTAAVFALVAGGAVAALTQSQQPITAARYALVIDGVEVTSFSHLAALDRATTTPPHPLSGKPVTVRLVRPLTGAMEIDRWYETAAAGATDAAKKNLHLIAYSAQGEPVARYWLTNAWPSEVRVTGTPSGGTDALTQHVTLTASSATRVQP